MTPRVGDRASQGIIGTVLVVDDEPFILSATKMVLAGSGFEVHTCDAWTTVFSTIRRVSPDIVLLDYNMPTLRGDNICSILKRSALNPEMKVVFYSSEDRGLMERVTKSCGADGFIPKNTGPAELVDSLTELLA